MFRYHYGHSSFYFFLPRSFQFFSSSTVHPYALSFFLAFTNHSSLFKQNLTIRALIIQFLPYFVVLAQFEILPSFSSPEGGIHTFGIRRCMHHHPSVYQTPLNASLLHDDLLYCESRRLAFHHLEICYLTWVRSLSLRRIPDPGLVRTPYFHLDQRCILSEIFSPNGNDLITPFSKLKASGRTPKALPTSITSSQLPALLPAQ